MLSNAATFVLLGRYIGFISPSKWCTVGARGTTSSVADIAKALPAHSWEWGTAEALLELYNPAISVFGDHPFPAPVLNPSTIPALAYAQEKIMLNAPGAKNGLSDGDGALNAPRWSNGAISQRFDVAELWDDFGYMSPPFLAYYAADTRNISLLEESYKQCGYYREVLQATIPPQDLGLWSTGNGWFSAGMVRVLAVIQKAPAATVSPWRAQAIADLTQWIKEIVNGVMGAPMDDGLLRNYLDDTDGPNGFGEISGSTMMAAVIYRMAVLQPDVFGTSYIAWADNIRHTISGSDRDGNPHVTSNGTVTPAVNPYAWLDTTPYTAGSPEGNNFVVLMYAGWRDCVYAGYCHTDGSRAKRLHNKKRHSSVQ
ncbi:hypothetical protein BDZ89DRAFT_1094498 [Hymenopellis radicata]|nr:hypothetical protein BDZ89DRAFT_1094498 [Hymenopellis radicata]